MVSSLGKATIMMEYHFLSCVFNLFAFFLLYFASFSSTCKISDYKSHNICFAYSWFKRTTNLIQNHFSCDISFFILFLIVKLMANIY